MCVHFSSLLCLKRCWDNGESHANLTLSLITTSSLLSFLLFNKYLDDLLLSSWRHFLSFGSLVLIFIVSEGLLFEVLSVYRPQQRLLSVLWKFGRSSGSCASVLYIYTEFRGFNKPVFLGGFFFFPSLAGRVGLICELLVSNCKFHCAN